MGQAPGLFPVAFAEMRIMKLELAELQLTAGGAICDGVL